MAFARAPEYEVWPGRGLTPYQAAVRAAHETAALIERSRPAVVVADILTVAGGLAAQMTGTPVGDADPPRPPRLRAWDAAVLVGRAACRARRSATAFWGRSTARSCGVPSAAGASSTARASASACRRSEHVHGGISRELALVGTFPQLEYPRYDVPPSVRFTGPAAVGAPGRAGRPPPGDAPLVLVAPSTSQDPEQRMVRAALAGLADQPVRVLATLNNRPSPVPLDVPANARVVDWLSYARTMPLCDAVICHAGHGTVARALASGVPVVGCPAAGDMAENAARLAWSGCGISLPRRFVTARGVRLAVRRVLGDASYAERARQLGAWAERHDGAAVAADAVEELAARP